MVDVLGLKMLVNWYWNIVVCLVVIGEGLFEGFDWFVKDCADRIYMFD